jgi:preprotein translocase subunit SecG
MKIMLLTYLLFYDALSTSTLNIGHVCEAAGNGAKYGTYSVASTFLRNTEIKVLVRTTKIYATFKFSLTIAISNVLGQRTRGNHAAC